MSFAPQIDVECARRQGPEALLKAMTEAVIDRWTATDQATEDDLARFGFSRAEIARHGPAAIERAAKLGADGLLASAARRDRETAPPIDETVRLVAAMDEAIARLTGVTARHLGNSGGIR